MGGSGHGHIARRELGRRVREAELYGYSPLIRRRRSKMADATAPSVKGGTTSAYDTGSSGAYESRCRRSALFTEFRGGSLAEQLKDADINEARDPGQ